MENHYEYYYILQTVNLSLNSYFQLLYYYNNKLEDINIKRITNKFSNPSKCGDTKSCLIILSPYLEKQESILYEHLNFNVNFSILKALNS